MPEVYRAIQIHFAKAEIEEILRERAKALVLTRKDHEKLDVATVRHVEGEAVVHLGHRAAENDRSTCER